MQDKKTLVTILAILTIVFLSAAGYYYMDCQSLRNQLETEKQAKLSAQAEQEKLSEQLSALNAQHSARLNNSPDDSAEEIANLEKLLAQRENEVAELRQQLADGRPRGGRGNRRGGGNFQDMQKSMEERMEQLKEENPELYARLEERRVAFEKRIEELENHRETFFNNLDTSKLSSDKKQLLNDYNQLRDRIAGGDFNPRAFGELMRMNNEVREALIENLGKNLGVSDSALSDGISEIMEITGGNLMGGPGGFGPPPSRRFRWRSWTRFLDTFLSLFSLSKFCIDTHDAELIFSL